MSVVYVILLAIFHTLRISVRTVWQASRGKLTQAIANQTLDEWSVSFLRSARIQVEVRGSEHMVPDEVYVVMSNHQSLYDIPILFQTIVKAVTPPLSLRMVAKTELFRVPFWGRAMSEAGFVEVDRSDRTQALASLESAGERMRSTQTSVWIAPEGTRSPTGHIARFKRGGFHLASVARVRILPVTISHARDVLPKKQWRVRKGVHVRVVIHPPVSVPGEHAHELKEFAETVRQTIEAALEL